MTERYSWWVKADRAEEHIRQFLGAAPACTALTPEDLRLLGDPAFGGPAVTTQTIAVTGKPVPAWLAAVAGDALHNLRSALDHIAVALTSRREAKFPVTIAWNKNSEATFKGMLSGAPDAAVELIRQMQPASADLSTSHPLAILHMLNIHDKHRALMLVTTHHRVVSAQPVVSEGEAIVHELRLGEGAVGGGGAELFAVDMTIPHGAKVLVRFDIESQITFAEEGTVKGKGVVPVLWELLGRVRTILDTVEPFVSQTRS